MLDQPDGYLFWYELGFFFLTKADIIHTMLNIHMESEHFSHISRCLSTLNQTNLYFGFSFCQEDYILHLIKSILSTNSLFTAKLWSNKSEVHVWIFLQTKWIAVCISRWGGGESQHLELQGLCKCLPQHNHLTEEKVGTWVIKQHVRYHTVFINVCSPTFFVPPCSPCQQIYYLFTIIWMIQRIYKHI